jgi:hypothetical protein
MSCFRTFYLCLYPPLYGWGRIGRFLMNAMLASGGHSWTVIPVETRKVYMAALEEASVNQNISDFATFLARLVGDSTL